jgi:HAD superfamily hydrolase (TIGR01450 family)
VGTWVLDMDGVLWRGTHLIAGSDVAVRQLMDAGHRVVCCTNHARSPESKEELLERLGVPRCPVVTSAESAAARCVVGERVLVLGDPTLVECLRGYGLDAVDVTEVPDGAAVPGVDAVVVGATDRWDRSRIGMVADAVRAGARFLATNDDPTYPSSGVEGTRLLPGNGALVAAVATTAGRGPEVTGKPYGPMADLLNARFGPVDVVVGDKPETDGALAVQLAARFALVLSGVTEVRHLPVVPAPWKVADDLATLVEHALVEAAGAGAAPRAAEGPGR